MQDIFKQLFSWDDWEKSWNSDGELEDLTFYQIELKTQIGHFQTGTKFYKAYINFMEMEPNEAWILHLYPTEFDEQENDKQKTYLFPLNLTVGVLKQ